VGCTHLSVSAAKERADSVELIEKAVKGRAKPVFVTGDWNSLPDSSVLADLSRFLRVLSPTDGRTYHGRPANGPSGTTTDFCIDYIAVDSVHAPQFTVVDSGVVADRVSSDHAPIFVTLVPE
jgi:endonuclease/exonuclease/phosphatase family metal-dependent hydrolase